MRNPYVQRTRLIPFYDNVKGNKRKKMFPSAPFTFIERLYVVSIANSSCNSVAASAKRMKIAHREMSLNDNCLVMLKN